MRRLLIVFVIAFPFSVSAQTIDSTSYKQVDSLIKVSRALTGKSDFKTALEVNAQAEKIALSTFGPTSASYGSVCYNHGRIMHAKGDYPEAEKRFLESKTIREKVLVKEHPDYAMSLNNLAILYWAMGQYEKSEPLYLESKEIREKVLGKEHPYYAQSLNNLAILYQDMRQYEKSEIFFNGSVELDRKIILSALHHLSEKEMNQYLLTFKVHAHTVFSFMQNTSGKTGIAKTAYDNTLFYKGFLLHASIQSKQLVMKDTAAVVKYNLLRSYGVRLSKEYSKPIAERKGVIELEEKSNELEKEIARTVAGYQEAKKQVSWKEVQQKT